MTTYDCVVVGAGISGLSAAHALRRQGAEVLVVEASDRVGGAVRTVQSDGYVMDCGPNTVTSSDPLLLAHFVELGIEAKRVTADQNGGRRFILLNGKPELIPMSPPDLLKTPLLSTQAKLRVLAEPFLPSAHTSDESVAAFLSRRLGPEPVERLADPFLSGVLAGNPAELSMKATFPSIWEAEQRAGSIIRGMITQRKHDTSARMDGPRPKSVLFNFQRGLASWPEAIARALGPDRVWLDARATSLNGGENSWQLTVERNGRSTLVETDIVILATPAYASADLVAELDADAAKALRGIPYAPMVTVHLAYPRDAVEHPLDGFGVLCPSVEQRKVLGILWPSTLFPTCVPKGKDMVMTLSYVGGSQKPGLAQLSDEALIELVVREHEEILGARGAPVMTHITRWTHAIPQYIARHVDRMIALERLEAERPGLYLLGNYRDGVGVSKCWQNGRALAEHIVHQRLPRHCVPVGV